MRVTIIVPKPSRHRVTMVSITHKKKKTHFCHGNLSVNTNNTKTWQRAQEFSKIFLCRDKMNKLPWRIKPLMWLAVTSSWGMIYQRKCSKETWEVLESDRSEVILGFIYITLLLTWPRLQTLEVFSSSLSTANTNLATTNDFWRLTKHLREPPVMDSSCCWTENYYHLFKKIASDAAVSEGDIG